MGIIKGLVFDGVNSHTYGVGLTGRDVYNAPERDVELITIPGRNGEYALDKKRYRNIDITYHAGMFDTNQPDFAKRISDFKNELLSRRGYKRLEDEYDVNVFRMGIFKSGLEVNPVTYQRAGEFDLTFTCKPQRFLKSGEEKSTITTGIVNPTQYDSKPLLEVEGYGDIDINGQKISIQNEEIGETLVYSSAVAYADVLNVTMNDVLANGDTFSPPVRFNCTIRRNPQQVSTVELTGTPWTVYIGAGVTLDYIYEPIITYGTASNHTSTGTVTINETGGASATYTLTLTVYYDGAQTLTCTFTKPNDASDVKSNFIIAQTLTAYSTLSALGHPTYIDLDIGECYMIKNGEMVSLNNNITLGGELPVLKPGANPITFDNTITDLKITPRWWIL